MTSAFTTDIQLRAEVPPIRDIFRVFRANHPETLAFTNPSRIAGPAADFKPETAITLRSTDGIWARNSILGTLKDAATKSAATDQINLMIDVNSRLQNNAFAAAEDLLGRPLTDAERASKAVSDAYADPVTKAISSAKLEEMKAWALHQRKKYILQLAKWEKATTAKAKHDALTAAAAAHAKAMAELEAYADAVEEWRAQGYDDLNNFNADDDDDQFDEFEDDEDPDLDPANLPPLPDEQNDRFANDDEGSIAPTVAMDGEQKDDDDGSVATTVVDRPINSLYNNQWKNKPYKPNKDQLKARLMELKEFTELPEMAAAVNYKSSTDKDGLIAMVKAGQDILDKQVDKERGTHDAKVEAKEKARLANRQGEAAPLQGEGLRMEGLFSKSLRKPKNPTDYVKFGPKYAINTKKLKAGQFSILYLSGHKPQSIRDTALTPALKEIVNSYLAGDPFDSSQLEPKELEWLTEVWRQTKLSKAPALTIVPKKYPGREDMKHRLKVLMGENLAGNDGVFEEITKIVDQMEELRWLSPEELIKFRRFIAAS